MSEENLQSGQKPFMDHLDELLLRLRWCFIYILAGCVVAYALSRNLVGLLTDPVNKIPYLTNKVIPPKIIITAPFEQMMVYLRLSVIAGFFFAFPAVAYEVAKFVGPGLKSHEKRRVVYLSLSLYITFLLGIFIGYEWVLPVVLSAIVRFGGESNIANTWSMNVYISSSLGVLLISAFLIQLPVVMTHLSTWGWVKAASWAKFRRQSIVVNAIVSGILAPPDWQSMIAMMIPVQLLYESGIVFARVAEWVFNEKTKSQ